MSDQNWTSAPWTGWVVPPPLPSPTAAPAAPVARKTLMFANDKSSGKTTTANAVIVSLLEHHRALMSGVSVREYERHPRLSTIFRREDGIGSVEHHDARNAEAFDRLREMLHDPNATLWDDLLYRIGQGALIVDFGSNMFAEISRILDDEPRPIFPNEGHEIGVAIPVTTAGDSIESAISAAEAVLSWGPRCQVFLVQQEYLGRFDDHTPVWATWKHALLAREPWRVQAITIERLLVADIGRVVFQRIDRLVADATAALRSNTIQGADYIRAVRAARAEIGWGQKTLEAVRPIADWFAR